MAPTFRFSAGQLPGRIWAAVHPYGISTTAGERVRLELRILNHSPRTETYRVKWTVADGWKVVEADPAAVIKPRQESSARVALAPAAPGLYIVTGDIEFASSKLREWAEAMVRVQ